MVGYLVFDPCLFYVSGLDAVCLFCLQGFGNEPLLYTDPQPPLESSLLHRRIKSMHTQPSELIYTLREYETVPNAGQFDPFLRLPTSS